MFQSGESKNEFLIVHLQPEFYPSCELAKSFMINVKEKLLCHLLDIFIQRSGRRKHVSYQTDKNRK